MLKLSGVRITLASVGKNGVTIDIVGQPHCLLTLELLAGRLIWKYQPACQLGVTGFIEGIDLVLGLKAVGHDLELQQTDCAQQDMPECVFKNLDRPFLSEFTKALGQLLGLEGIACPCDPE